MLIAVSLLHAVLLCHDLAQPDAFLRGDRSYDRLGKTAYVFDATVRDDWVDQPALLAETPGVMGRMVEVGPPGDYLVAGTLLKTIGQYPLILLQVLLTIAAAALVYAIGRSLGRGARTAAVGALIFSLLPGTLVQGHLFVAEAWAMPSLALAVWASLQLSLRGPQARWVALSVLGWSLAVFFRTHTRHTASWTLQLLFSSLAVARVPWSRIYR